ncbi:MAG: hypothetical protein USCGTAYLOR_00195 [Chromatiales bacterium USCg_Taylor]|nr:MAG: hypothetical protein USCGTAYLOR_00195 [Chromatiales bacterium USCg_Taylor]
MRDVRLGTFDPLLSTIFGGNAFLAGQQVWSVDAYHDVTSKFKLVWEIRC